MYGHFFSACLSQPRYGTSVSLKMISSVDNLVPRGTLTHLVLYFSSTWRRRGYTTCAQYSHRRTLDPRDLGSLFLHLSRSGTVALPSPPFSQHLDRVPPVRWWPDSPTVRCFTLIEVDVGSLLRGIVRGCRVIGQPFVRRQQRFASSVEGFRRRLTSVRGCCRVHRPVGILPSSAGGEHGG